MTTLFLNRAKIYSILLFLVIINSSCTQSPSSNEPPLTPTSSVPGYSFVNPAPFGEMLIQQIGGVPERDIAPQDYLEIRPEAFMINADSFIDSTSSSSPGVGYKYVLVMISFTCREGILEEKDCTRFNQFRITDSNGNEYEQELNFFYQADGNEYLNVYDGELNFYYHGEEWQFFNRSDILNDNGKLNEGETITGAAIFEIKKDAEGLVLSYSAGNPHPLYWELPEKDE